MRDWQKKPGSCPEPARPCVQQLMEEARRLRSRSIAEFLRDARSWLSAAFRKAFRRRRLRRQLHELLAYDDRLLRDMGITRYDLLTALRDPGERTEIPRREGGPDNNDTP